jgi:hypothetical protein
MRGVEHEVVLRLFLPVVLDREPTRQGKLKCLCMGTALAQTQINELDRPLLWYVQQAVPDPNCNTVPAHARRRVLVPAAGAGLPGIFIAAWVQVAPMRILFHDSDEADPEAAYTRTAFIGPLSYTCRYEAASVSPVTFLACRTQCS